MYQPRQLAPVLQQALSGFPAVLITGPRQSGKTTFLKHEAQALVNVKVGQRLPSLPVYGVGGEGERA